MTKILYFFFNSFKKYAIKSYSPGDFLITINKLFLFASYLTLLRLILNLSNNSIILKSYHLLFKYHMDFR